MEKEKKFVAVIWLKGYAGHVSYPGMKSSVEADLAPKLFKEGYIQIIPGDDKPVNPLPQDLPARNILFEQGFNSIEKIKKAGDSLGDVLSKQMLGKVKKYLETVVETTTNAATTTVEPKG